MTRIFDHLNGEPEDKRFSRVAHEMRRSDWWRRMPMRDEPTVAVGEIARTR